MAGRPRFEVVIVFWAKNDRIEGIWNNQEEGVRKSVQNRARALNLISLDAPTCIHIFCPNIATSVSARDSLD